MTDKPQDSDREATVLEYQDRIAQMSDRELRQTYMDATGEAGDPWVDALAEECRVREIEI